MLAVGCLRREYLEKVQAMIISPGRGYIFVHIPKTGGTALSLALEAKAMKEDILIGDTPKARARRGRMVGAKTSGRLWKHSSLAEIEGIVERADLEDFLIVTVVRNPWDRLVSYYYWLRDQSFSHPAVGLAKSRDFSGFLHHRLTQTALRLWPYGRYLQDGGGRELPALILRHEALGQDVGRLEAEIGCKLVLPRINMSDRKADWRGYYTLRDQALVAELCAEDIARFGYRFEG